MLVSYKQHCCEKNKRKQIIADLEEQLAECLETSTALGMKARWQTHLGDGVPINMYQDLEKQFPATVDGDLVAVWVDPTTGAEFIQEDINSRPELSFPDGVPTLNFDGIDDFMTATIPNLAESGLIVNGFIPAGDTLFTAVNMGIPNDTWGRYSNGISYPGSMRNVRIDGFSVIPSSGKTVVSTYSGPEGYTEWVNGSIQGNTTGSDFNGTGNIIIGNDLSLNPTKWFSGQISSVFIHTDKDAQSPLTDYARKLMDPLFFHQYLSNLIDVGSPLSPGAEVITGDLVRDLDSAGILPYLDEIYLLSGPPTLAGAMVKLKKLPVMSGIDSLPVLTTSSFVESDYNPATGVKSDGTKHFITGVSPVAHMNANSIMLFAYGYGMETYNAADYAIAIGVYGGAFPSQIIDLVENAFDPQFRYFRAGTDLIKIEHVLSAPNGSLIGNRRSPSDSSLLQNGVSGVDYTGLATIALTHHPVFLFALDSVGSPSNYSLARYKAFCIGKGMTNAMATTLHNAFDKWSNRMEAMHLVDDYKARLTAAGVQISDNNLSAARTLLATLANNGILSKIYEIYLLAGPNSVNGTLVKLKYFNNPTITNVNFVSTDYDIKLGLKGNGSNKYLNTNLTENEIAHNSIGLVVNGDTFSMSSGTIVLMGASNGVNPETQVAMYELYVTTERAFITSTAASTVASATTGSSGTIAGIRTPNGVNGNVKIYHNGLMQNNIAGVPPNTFDAPHPLFIFALNNGGSPYAPSAARLRFAAVTDGTLTNAQQVTLHNAINTWQNSINGYSSILESYVARLSEAGSSLVPDNYTALTNFLTTLESQNILNKLKYIYPLAGPDTLEGALTPLKGTEVALTNIGFVPADYSITEGIKGDGVSKFLDTGISPESYDSSWDVTLFVNASGLSSSGPTKTLMGTSHSEDSELRLSERDSGYDGRVFISNGDDADYVAIKGLPLPNTTSIAGVSSAFTVNKLYQGGVLVASSSSSPPSVEQSLATMYLFAMNEVFTATQFSPARISFVAITGKTLTDLEIQTLSDAVDIWKTELVGPPPPPVYAVDTDGNIILDADGNPIPVLP